MDQHRELSEWMSGRWEIIKVAKKESHFPLQRIYNDAAVFILV
jgi:hypothetical protein